MPTPPIKLNWHEFEDQPSSSTMVWNLESERVSPEHAPLDFYTNGEKIGGWIRYPERGYDVSWHFAKETQVQVDWHQELAVKYYDREVIDFFEVVGSRKFKGYYDLRNRKYYRIAPWYRRRNLDEIRPEWLEELNEMPFIYDQFRKAGQPVTKSGPNLPPPEPLPPPREWLQANQGR